MPQGNGLRGVEHWGRPCEGDFPCGEDLSFDPEFELLTTEIGKDKSLHGNRKTDWVVVYTLADALLARSKDVWLFAYGIASVYHTRSVAECVTGINALCESIATRWDSLYPSLSRPQRRTAPLKWLCDKFHAIAANTAFLGIAPKDLSALNDAFVALQEKIDCHVLGNDLTFGSILRAQLEGGSTRAPVPEQPDPASSANQPAPAGQETHALQTTLEDIQKTTVIPSPVLPQVIRTINDNARQFGDHLLTINRDDERGYQMHRAALWSTLLQPPPSEPGGLTQLVCPVPPDMIDLYAAGINDKRYAEMLPQIERAASKAPFWFDGQHMVVICLEGISAFLPAFSIKHSLAQLVSRFPDILFLKYKDGRPFASAKTAAWIDSFIPAILGNSSANVGGQTFAHDAVQAEDDASALHHAIARAAEDGFSAGLDLLGTVPPGKTRAFFRHCILKARFCAALGQTQAAAFLLKPLIEKLKQWDLLDWEPELTAEAVSLLLSLFPKQQTEQEVELHALLHLMSLETALSAKRA